MLARAKKNAWFYVFPGAQGSNTSGCVGVGVWACGCVGVWVCGCGGVGVVGARRAALHFLQRLCDASAVTLRQRLEKIQCCSYSATTLRKRDQQKGYYAAAPESGPKIWDIWSFRTHVDEAQNLSHAGLSRGCRRGATDNIPGLQTMPTQGGHSKSE